MAGIKRDVDQVRALELELQVRLQLLELYIRNVAGRGSSIHLVVLALARDLNVPIEEQP